MRDERTVNCTTLINPTNTTIVFDVGWQAIPETIVFNMILFFVSNPGHNLLQIHLDNLLIYKLNCNYFSIKTVFPHYIYYT